MDDVLVIMVSRYAAQWILAGLGMNFGLQSMENEEEIVVWNWKTGRVLAVSIRELLNLVVRDVYLGSASLCQRLGGFLPLPSSHRRRSWLPLPPMSPA